MSKFNVKFSYAGQPAANVQEIHRGPIHLNNLVQTYSNPKYEQINLPNVEHHPAQTVIPVVPTVDVESKPQSPQIIRAKSKEHLPKVTPSEIKEKQVDNLKPILNIQEVNESQFKNVESHKKEANHKIQNSEEIVLKAPSFKFQPKKEGDISRVTKKEYVRAENAQKYLYSGIPQKSQDEFVGCFGCMRKKPKSYSIQKAHK